MLSSDDRKKNVLICDLLSIGSNCNKDPDLVSIRQHIEAHGGRLIEANARDHEIHNKGLIDFYYLPHLSGDALMKEVENSDYDAVICAATNIPAEASFRLGGVRIGTGTANMQSLSWGGVDGTGGSAVLMNTPGINARATAQSVIKTIFRWLPDLAMNEMHDRVVSRNMDTASHLSEYSMSRIDGFKATILGFGHIGREVARMLSSTGMKISVYARPKYRELIEANDYEWHGDIQSAAHGANIISIHTGLGPYCARTNSYSNEGIIDAKVLSALADEAVLINYDRAGLLDRDALREALTRGKVSHVAIDADIFLGAQGEPHGPLSQFIDLSDQFPDKILLLPHAAADTDRVSRCQGAKLAVTMISELIHSGNAHNVVGETPPGFVDCGRIGYEYTDLASLKYSIEELSHCDLESVKRDLKSVSDFLERITDTTLESDDMNYVNLCAIRLASFLKQSGLTRVPL